MAAARPRVRRPGCSAWGWRCWLAVGLAAAAGCARADCRAFEAAPADAGVLAAPAGFVVSRVLSGLVEPTQLAFDTRGRAFVLEGSPTAPKQLLIYGRDWARAGGLVVNTEGESTGLLVVGAGEQVLVASRGRVDRYLGLDVGNLSVAQPWVEGLPVDGEHANHGLALGPDGLVYFGVGSTCDLCDEVDARSATVMRADPGQARPAAEVFARGLRNAYDVAFTDDGQLVATDNGPECCEQSPGCTHPGPDRLLRVTAGADLGWPAAFRGEGFTAAGTLTTLPLHGGATGFTVVRQPGCDDAEVAFVTLWGTQHGVAESGRQVLRVRLVRSASGALEGATPAPFLGPDGLVHPIDAAVGGDGALYVLDHGGAVVRVAPAAGTCL